MGEQETVKRLECDMHYFLEEIKDIMYNEVSRGTYDDVCTMIEDFERRHFER